MGADLEFSAGLNDRDFKAGLAKMEEDGHRTANALNEAFAALSFKHVFREGMSFARESIEAYEKAAGLTESEIAKQKNLLDELKVGIGRDLYNAWKEFNGLIEWGGKKLEEMRTTATNFYADLLRPVMGGDGSSEDIDRINKENEAIGKNIAELKKAKEARDAALKAGTDPGSRLNKIDAREWLAGELALDPIAGKKAEVEARRRETEMEILKIQKEMTEEERKQTNWAQVWQNFATHYNAELNNVYQQEREQMEKRQQEEENDQRRVRMHAEELDLAVAANALEIDKARGLEDQVKQRELELAYIKQIRDINNDDLLTNKEKGDRMRELVNQYQDAKSALAGEIAAKNAGGDNHGRARTLGVGLLGGAGLRDQVFSAPSQTQSPQVQSSLRIEGYFKQALSLLDGTKQAIQQQGGPTYQ